MNNNLEFENEDPSPDSIEDNHPRTNYGEGYYEEPKQETLEEASEFNFEKQVSNPYSTGTAVYTAYEKGFELGAKWQAERSYSEEDLKEAFRQSRQAEIFEKNMPPVYESFEEWFEQFKKK